MSQTTITLAFEQWKAQQGTTGEPVLLDEFVFANVPGLDPDQPVDRNETLPPAEQIVHRQAVSRKGVVNDNAVVHSVVLGADVGDFSFNWIGLINKASGTLAMIVHAPLQQKLKTAEGQQGNVLTRSFLMEYNGAQAETGINTPAETWQIDFTARMTGMDERQRLENIDIFGAAAFFGDGYLVGKSGNQFYVTKGTGYVAGLRTTLAANLNITVTTRPVKVWLDVCWTGTLTSVWGVQSRITVADNLADYVQNGVQHYVFAVAGIDENGNITDLRPKGTLNEQQASDALRKHEQSRNHPDATTREKGFVRLSSDTNSESESLAATPKAVKAAMDNANGRVPSDRKVNGHPLSGDITLWASDVKAISADAIGQITDNGTMASANTPGWWRVAVSNSDTVADFPTYPDGSKLYSYGYMFVEKIGEVWFQHYYAHMGANAKRQDWGTVPNTSRPWVIDYNTANKPSAGDVGALP
ncbi:phage tail protein, partial [Salmonella enterica subsp. enterica]|nr:phage tail protein [Salmonella enterica subsp. enterica serovar Newport]